MKVNKPETNWLESYIGAWSDFLSEVKSVNKQ